MYIPRLVILAISALHGLCLQYKVALKAHTPRLPGVMHSFLVFALALVFIHTIASCFCRGLLVITDRLKISLHDLFVDAFCRRVKTVDRLTDDCGSDLQHSY
jgi:hypothetical protein